MKHMSFRFNTKATVEVRGVHTEAHTGQHPRAALKLSGLQQQPDPYTHTRQKSVLKLYSSIIFYYNTAIRGSGTSGGYGKALTEASPFL